MGVSAGIVGIGTYLPSTIRRNDWWSRELVDGWLAARRPPPTVTAPSDGVRRVLAAMAEQGADPFQGVRERRVIAEDTSSADMEVAAARDALTAAGVAPEQIDLVLSHTAVPEYLASNTACVIHDRLGLAPSCVATQVDAAGYSFLMQLAIAEQWIASGRARHALLVQSCAASRLLDRDEPHSVLLGDGAAAVVVGAVASGGILAAAHRTDGSRPRVLVATVPGKRWYDDGRVVLHRADPAAAFTTFLETADRAKEVVDALLARAGHRADDIDFFAAHQGTPWLRRVIQETIGLARARSVDVFAHTGYVQAVSIPLVLAAGQRDGLLRDGDLVLAFGGGVGATYGATLMRWAAR